MNQFFLAIVRIINIVQNTFVILLDLEFSLNELECLEFI